MITLSCLRFLRRFVTALLLGSLTASPGWAGAIDKKFGSDPAAIARKVKLNLMSMGSGSPKGTGPVPYLPALGTPPKRVALVSFYVWDAGNEEHSVYNTSMQWSTTKTVTGTGRERAANALYQAAVQPMKEAFAAAGMQLLTPQEFLNTPEKKPPTSRSPPSMARWVR